MRILITGGSGFIGRHISEICLRRGHELIIASRTENQFITSNKNRITYFNVGSFDKDINWSQALDGCNAVIHLAAHVHITNKLNSSERQRFIDINACATENLAKMAAKAGINRFVYLSSVSVHGITTDNGLPFTECSPYSPASDYAYSKMLAEAAIQKISKSHDLKYTIIRPPLVYGENAPGNILRLKKLLKTGLPLPFEGLNNKRSYIGIDNLIDFIFHCLDSKLAINQAFLISDFEDVTTSEFIKIFSQALGINANLFKVSDSKLHFISAFLSRPDIYNSMCRSLQINSTKVQNILGWQPILTLREGLLRAAK